ncbi:MAG TPA: hypothetical protein VF407_22285 [Polyangiaceae bacterium]
MARADTWVIVLTPALSFATLAVGLHVGASGETVAAVVEGAPPSGENMRLAWQVKVYRADRGVREVVPNEALTVTLDHSGHTSSLAITTTPDGVAEMVAPLPGVRGGDDVVLSISRARDGLVLAQGHTTVPAFAKRGSESKGFLPYFARDGAIVLDVATEGGALPGALPGIVSIRAKDASGQPVVGATLTFEANDFGIEKPETTRVGGWANVSALALLNGELKITATKGDLKGTWSGAIPVKLGAIRAAIMPEPSNPDHKMLTLVRATTSAAQAYVEIDDAHGRAWAATPLLEPAPNGGSIGAQISLPQDLATDRVWVVAGTLPDSAETLAAGTSAWMQIDDPSPSSEVLGARSIVKAGTFGRTVVLDGFALASARASERKKKGLTIAIGALVAGAIVEAIAILRGASKGSAVKATWITGKMGTIVIGVGLAIVGFFMLAAFVATH